MRSACTHTAPVLPTNQQFNWLNTSIAGALQAPQACGAALQQAGESRKRGHEDASGVGGWATPATQPNAVLTQAPVPGAAAAITGSWQVHASQTVSTRAFPLSEFEAALLVQAQQVHGNRWTLIASQLLPWRLPIELRTVCLAKTPDEWAVSNSYLSAGFTLDLLLANSPPEYKAQWQAFWACRQQQQAAAGVSPESQAPSKPPKSSAKQPRPTHSESEHRSGSSSSSGGGGSSGGKQRNRSGSSSSKLRRNSSSSPQAMLGAEQQQTSSVMLQATQLAVAELGRRISMQGMCVHPHAANGAHGGAASIPHLALAGPAASAFVGAQHAAIPVLQQPQGRVSHCDPWGSIVQQQQQQLQGAQWLPPPATAAVASAAPAVPPPPGSTQMPPPTCWGVPSTTTCAVVEAPPPAACAGAVGGGASSGAGATGGAGGGGVADDDLLSFLDNLSGGDAPEWADEVAEQAAAAAWATTTTHDAVAAPAGVSRTLSCSAAAYDAVAAPAGVSRTLSCSATATAANSASLSCWPVGAAQLQAVSAPGTVAVAVSAALPATLPGGHNNSNAVSNSSGHTGLLAGNGGSANKPPHAGASLAAPPAAAAHHHGLLHSDSLGSSSAFSTAACSVAGRGGLNSQGSPLEGSPMQAVAVRALCATNSSSSLRVCAGRTLHLAATAAVEHKASANSQSPPPAASAQAQVGSAAGHCGTAAVAVPTSGGAGAGVAAAAGAVDTPAGNSSIAQCRQAAADLLSQLIDDNSQQCRMQHLQLQQGVAPDSQQQTLPQQQQQQQQSSPMTQQQQQQQQRSFYDNLLDELLQDASMPHLVQQLMQEHNPACNNHSNTTAVIVGCQDASTATTAMHA